MPFVHTYLIQPGLWELSGFVQGADGARFKQEGELLVSHKEDLWLIDGQLTIFRENPQAVTTRYEITPLAPEGDVTEWKSEVGGPEPIFGLFVLVDDAIMSPWQSASGAYWGQEFLAQVSDGEYRGRGFTFLKRDKVSSWSARLIRRR